MRVKQPTTALPAPTDIDLVRSRLDRWRRTRPHRARIPDTFWTAATALARQHGSGKIARLLRLDYYALRRRLGADRPATPAGGPAAFVEVPPTALGAPAWACVIEGERPDGGRLRIQCTGPHLPDLVALGQGFWGGRP